jgi:hypothetical protein
MWPCGRSIMHRRGNSFVTSTFPATVVLGQSAQPANGRNTAGGAVSVVIPIVIGNSASANRAAQEFQVEPRGEWLRKDGACRGLDIRAATFVSPFSEFEMKDWMLQRIE